MNVAELGEFGLVKLISEMIARSRNPQQESWRRLIVGIGDDCAAWQGDVTVQLVHVDSLFEDIHFTLETTPWRELGWKSLAATVSDIAAMGGIPTYALISLTLHDDTEVDDVKAFYEGMLELAGRFGIAIIGGDTGSASVVSVTTTVLGHMLDDKKESLLLRSTAHPGDKIAVTSSLGGAAGGLEMLTKNLALDEGCSLELQRAFTMPLPRIVEGQALAAHGVKAAIDISDGLISDLTHICRASGVSAQVNVDRVPVNPALRVCFKDRALPMALSGGEDYELLFTAPEHVIQNVKKAIACPVTVIGDIMQGKPEVSLVDAQGKPYALPKKGWEHFRS